MAFQFIHTGDWHLAKPFGRFDAEKQALLREARARIVDRIGALARQTGARTVLVAGDVFDTELVSDGVLQRLAARLEQYPDISWHFLAGNHDPARANGVWERFARMVPAANVIMHVEARLYELDADVDLLVAPLRARAIAHDPTGWMVERESAPGRARIGLAHGAIQGFGSSGEASVLIAPDRARSANLDYLALGDWHGVRQIGPKTWYAGTPEPDQFPDNEPGFALAVSIDGAGTPATVTPHKIGHYKWQKVVLRHNMTDEIAALERTLLDDGDDISNALLNIVFAGHTSLENEMVLRAAVERLSHLVFHLEADFDALVVDTGEGALDVLDDPLLARVGQRLKERMEAADVDQSAIAHRALRLLADLTRRQGDRG